MNIQYKLQRWLSRDDLSDWMNWSNFETFISSQYDSESVFPPRNQILRCFDLTAFQDIKVVLLGQDPYHGPSQAHGLSFSVPQGVKLPPSLRNIFKELKTIGVNNGSHGCLDYWARQGVLLLNNVLTVPSGRPGGHRGIGWEVITNSLIQAISNHLDHVVFLLWGRDAAQKAQLIEISRHCILIAPHPSPLSAYRGFFGCDHFRKTNQYLKRHGRSGIEWALPEAGLFHNEGFKASIIE